MASVWSHVVEHGSFWPIFPCNRSCLHSMIGWQFEDCPPCWPSPLECRMDCRWPLFQCPTNQTLHPLCRARESRTGKTSRHLKASVWDEKNWHFRQKEREKKNQSNLAPHWVRPFAPLRFPLWTCTDRWYPPHLRCHCSRNQRQPVWWIAFGQHCGTTTTKSYDKMFITMLVLTGNDWFWFSSSQAHWSRPVASVQHRSLPPQTQMEHRREDRPRLVWLPPVMRVPSGTVHSHHSTLVVWHQ